MNKEKFSIIKPRDRYVPSFAEVNRAGAEFVYYGSDNKFPQYLWGLYLKSPILSSIINGTSDFVYAGGIEWNPNLTIANDPDYVNLDGEGEIEKTYAVNIFTDSNIIDYGDYSEVKNMNTNDKINFSSGKVTINNSADKL